jgi:hypothetical protein
MWVTLDPGDLPDFAICPESQDRTSLSPADSASTSAGPVR